MSDHQKDLLQNAITLSQAVQNSHSNEFRWAGELSSVQAKGKCLRHLVHIKFRLRKKALLAQTTKDCKPFSSRKIISTF